MSKQLTALLLKQKVDGIKNVKDRKQYLINCLQNQGLVKEQISIEPVKLDISHDTCRLCKSSSIIFSNHEKICQDCGISESNVNINPFKSYKQDVNFSKSTFIEPGTTFVTIIKDGKEVKRDLAKLNTWTNSDPEQLKMANNLKRINDILDTLAINYNAIIFDRVRTVILSMFYNLINIKPDIRGKEKQALSLWCIYYPMVYSKLQINIQKLVSMFDIQIGEAYSYNFIMKDVFNNTPFEKYISLPIGTTSDIIISAEITKKLNKIKRDLKDYLSNPLKDKELYGIIYYISKQTNDKKFTLVYLSEKSGLSTVLISSEASKIETYYNKNLSLKSRLFQT
tara:strand:+ start:26164 stop:27180 length:1017 start_codon:yes stop_codon:yes gene_type:complete